jgi:hypothetical protein
MHAPLVAEQVVVFEKLIACVVRSADLAFGAGAYILRRALSKLRVGSVVASTSILDQARILRMVRFYNSGEGGVQSSQQQLVSAAQLAQLAGWLIRLAESRSRPP